MDSVSQFALGASCAALALHGDNRPWRAVLVGGLVATLPDLDVLFSTGSPIADVRAHRGHSHSLLWLTIASVPIARGLAAAFGERERLRRWWTAVWLALFTHPLLDALTVYGTKLALPFSEHAVAVGCMFVIDPLFTIPLLIGLHGYVRRGAGAGARWNQRGLCVACLYAAWSFVAQQLATHAAHGQLVAAGVSTQRVVVTPAPLQTLLWRVVAVDGDHAYEGFWSVFDGDRPVRFERIDRGGKWLAALRGNPFAESVDAFAQGFTKAERHGDALRCVDLRMGQEPNYVFAFEVARVREDGTAEPLPVDRKVGARIDTRRGLAWLWARMLWGDVASPR